MGLMRIREARPSDAPTLDAIYNHYVTETAITFDVEPWPQGRRVAWLAERVVNDDRVFVATEDEVVLGFAWSGPFRPKPAYRSTKEVSFYLAPDAVGRGTGSLLLSALLDELPRLGAHLAVAGTTVPNPASRALLVRHGFRSVGLFHQVGHK